MQSDDVIALGYVLVRMLGGPLPWSNWCEGDAEIAKHYTAHINLKLELARHPTKVFPHLPGQTQYAMHTLESVTLT